MSTTTNIATPDQVDVRGPRFAAWVTTAALVAVLVTSAVSSAGAAVLLGAQAVVFAIGALGYAALSYLTFKMPATLAEGELCGFVEQDFNAAGRFVHAPVSAWWISFTRLQEYWTAISVGLSVAFVGFALMVGRRAGGRTAAGAAMGGGVLAGILLWSFLPGTIARTVPESWHWPEYAVR